MSESHLDWTFFSNHGHVYFLIASNNEMTTREIAAKVGLTERAVANIIHDLVSEGYIKKQKIGRSNHYGLVPNKTLRHPLEGKVKLKELMKIISSR